VATLYRMTPISWKYLQPLASGVVAFAVCVVLNRFIYNLHTVIVLVLGGISFVAVYLGAYMLIGYDDDDRQVLEALKRKVMRGIS
ncbi:MAG: hypothetical protein KAU50_06665, partial [Candidatus Marinimicrobia bacterium]|nr:hypothetical protein [Candidatus Neomarinimicrobiota bacterium]